MGSIIAWANLNFLSLMLLASLSRPDKAPPGDGVVGWAPLLLSPKSLLIYLQNRVCWDAILSLIAHNINKNPS